MGKQAILGARWGVFPLLVATPCNHKVRVDAKLGKGVAVLA